MPDFFWTSATNLTEVCIINFLSLHYIILPLMQYESCTRVTSEGAAPEQLAPSMQFCHIISITFLLFQACCDTTWPDPTTPMPRVHGRGMLKALL